MVRDEMAKEEGCLITPQHACMGRVGRVETVCVAPYCPVRQPHMQLLLRIQHFAVIIQKHNFSVTI